MTRDKDYFWQTENEILTYNFYFPSQILKLVIVSETYLLFRQKIVIDKN